MGKQVMNASWLKRSRLWGSLASGERGLCLCGLKLLLVIAVYGAEVGLGFMLKHHFLVVHHPDANPTAEAGLQAETQ
jgi:hypothetical protein